MRISPAFAAAVLLAAVTVADAAAQSLPGVRCPTDPPGHADLQRHSGWLAHLRRVPRAHSRSGAGTPGRASGAERRCGAAARAGPAEPETGPPEPPDLPVEEQLSARCGVDRRGLAAGSSGGHRHRDHRPVRLPVRLPVLPVRDPQARALPVLAHWARVLRGHARPDRAHRVRLRRGPRAPGPRAPGPGADPSSGPEVEPGFAAAPVSALAADAADPRRSPTRSPMAAARPGRPSAASSESAPLTVPTRAPIPPGPTLPSPMLPGFRVPRAGVPRAGVPRLRVPRLRVPRLRVPAPKAAGTARPIRPGPTPRPPLPLRPAVMRPTNTPCWPGAASSSRMSG